jgi:hypothetical protein
MFIWYPSIEYEFRRMSIKSMFSVTLLVIQQKIWIGLDWIGLDWIGLDWIGLGGGKISIGFIL